MIVAIVFHLCCSERLKKKKQEQCNDWNVSSNDATDRNYARTTQRSHSPSVVNHNNNSFGRNRNDSSNDKDIELITIRIKRRD